MHKNLSVQYVLLKKRNFFPCQILVWHFLLGALTKDFQVLKILILVFVKSRLYQERSIRRHWPREPHCHHIKLSKVFFLTQNCQKLKGLYTLYCLRGHLFMDFQDHIEFEKLHGVKYPGTFKNESTCKHLERIVI